MHNHQYPLPNPNDVDVSLLILGGVLVIILALGLWIEAKLEQRKARELESVDALDESEAAAIVRQNASSNEAQN